MSNSIWRKKPMSAYEADIKNNKLNKVLGKWSLTAIGIGGIIGGGIFVLTGTAAHYHAGPALALSFVVAGIGCVFAALCYSEFASMLPVEGSAYAYAYGTMGEIFAWIIGWGLILEYAMGAMTVAVSWSGYFNKLLHLFGITMPYYLTNDPFSGAQYAIDNNITEPASFSFNLPAFLITWLVTWILVKGVKEAANTNNLIVILKLSAILFVIIVGIFFVNVDNWHPFIPEPEMVKHADGKMQEAYGIKGILSGAAAIFFAYIGFDVVSTSAGEAINPKKDIPFAIIASLAICTLLYILVSLVLTGMLNYKDITGDALKAPVAYAFDQVGQPWAVFIITTAATVGLVSVMLVMMLGQTRVFLGMAKDGLLPDFFSKIHPTFQTPWKSTLLVGLVVSLVASFTPIGVLSDMTSFGTLFAFAMVCLAVLILRQREPNRDRPFKTPLLVVIAPLGIITNVALMSLLDSKAQLFAFVWMGIGLVVYFIYSKSKSNLNEIE
ncbi:MULTISPECIES: amino acid permease [unclassified Arcicella]|uniref:APC family permease n=1 Tax=unclassified Arcicella TaxID=2644986 RepID=UPI0028572C77|nr:MULTISPECIES: amino acid permease [unclassified Arcicella]MDR6560557.1 APA family basic amino acid/polyamine antiporter [Arcicella sp. BE51]MDR6809837.1 APA family basic amino acid/polyamine antiporter [Arcicella sp. BE140]MDR6821186.1 APA family basic amino acid/polyamine antiporter [Arcicella sp. BE139]